MCYPHPRRETGHWDQPRTRHDSSPTVHGIGRKILKEPTHSEDARKSTDRVGGIEDERRNDPFPKALLHCHRPRRKLVAQSISQNPRLHLIRRSLSRPENGEDCQHLSQWEIRPMLTLTAKSETSDEASSGFPGRSAILTASSW